VTSHAFICDAIRTPFGRYGGALSSIRTDDLAAIPLKALMARNPKVDWQAVTDVIFGCANQAGEDNRNVAHMASLLAGLPVDLPGATINRLCGSGLDAIGTAARAIKAGEATLMIAGGVESMSRAPFVMPKADSAFARTNAVYDTTIGWRFVNKLMKEMHGVDSMPETAENVATEYRIEREAQDRMALASQQKAVAAQKAGYFDAEITPVTIAQKKGEAIVVAKDEHPRETSLEALGKLKGVVRPDGTVTAGNASGVNDGSCALLLADEASAARPDAEGARRRHGDGGRAAARDGDRAGAGDPESAGAHRPQARTDRRDRAQRSVCGPRPCRVADAGAEGRRRACEPERRRDCIGPSARRIGRAAGDHGREPVAQDGRPLRLVHHVHRRGAGDRGDSRAGVSAMLRP
jgi:acetyl-CoA acyltransferase